jgi:hypothetical protein
MRYVVKVPTNILRKMKQGCSNFTADESGVGVADYGAIFALLMLLGGLTAGWFLFSQPQSGNTCTTPNVQGGHVKMQPEFNCEACGGG